MNREELISLAERVEAATGRDLGLEADVLHTVFGSTLPVHWCGTSRALTASLDAVLALVAEKLPDHVWTLASGHQVGGANGFDGYGAEVAEFIQTPEYPEVFGRTPALALLAALLRALAAQTQEASDGR